MLKFSRKTDYAIVALTHLSQLGNTTAKEIADYYSFSRPMVSNVLKELAAVGLLQGQRGAKGGYYLKKSADQISIIAVLIAMEGPLEMMECTKDSHNCLAVAVCPSRSSMVVLQEQIHKLLSKISVADLHQQKTQHFFNHNQHSQKN